MGTRRLPSRYRQDLAVRFARKASPEPNTGCWMWTGAITGHGYGSIRDGRRGSLGAHKVAWELVNGPVPDELQVCHRCDNRWCVNAEHMFLGTIADNIADMVSKGRQSHQRGEAHGAAKLTWPEAAEIRRTYAEGGISQHKLAAKFGVTAMAVNQIVTNRGWRQEHAP